MRWTATAALALGLLALSDPPPAAAHCDTMDGPVVKEAEAALATGDVTPVLKWVSADRELEIRGAFSRALSVRAMGGEAKALAERFFHETLVRVHREGEGAPYTGLKPAGAEVDPALVASDRALETGTAEVLVGVVVAEVERGLRERFARAAEARRHKSESVERGREYVAAYVELMHYAERLRADATTAAHAGRGEPSPEGGHRH